MEEGSYDRIHLPRVEIHSESNHEIPARFTVGVLVLFNFGISVSNFRSKHSYGLDVIYLREEPDNWRLSKVTQNDPSTMQEAEK